MKHRMKYLFPVLALVFVSSLRAQTPCEGGFAGIYPCDKIDLEAFMPTNELGSLEGQNDIWGWTDPMNGKEYAIVGKLDGTAFVDVTTPTSPILIGFLPSHTLNSSTWRDIKVYMNYAYIVSEASGHGMQIFDLTELRDVEEMPTTFEETGHYNGFSNCHNININEETGYAYPVGTGQFGGGPHFINIQDPLNPVLEGSYGNQGYSHDAQVVTYSGPDTEHTGREIYFGFHGSGSDGLVIADVTEKSDPELLNVFGYDCQVYSHQGWLTPDHRFALLGDEIDEGTFGYNTKTRVFNIEDLNNPIHIGNFNASISSTDHNLYTKGDHAYMSNYTGGLRILDLTQLENGLASEVAYFDVHPSDDNSGYSGTWSNYPYFASGTIVVTHRTDGLFILKLQDLQGATSVNPLDTVECFTPVSLIERVGVDFSIGPNPVQNSLSIQAVDIVNKVEIYDLLGRPVFIEEFELSYNSTQVEIDLNKLSQGAYLVYLNGVKHFSKRFVKL